jgi:tetratricopeptide (TPR) repeat protein
MVAACFLLLAASQADAVSGIDLYNKGQYEQAYAQFQKDLQRNINPADIPKMEFDSGAAAYKLRNYDKALEAFSQSLVDPSPALQEKSHYNLGRTLEDRAELRQTKDETLRDLENAAQHYEQALKLDPQDKAAAERLEMVRRKIEQLKKHPKQPPPQPQKDQQKKKEENKDQEQQQQQQQSQNQQQQNQEQQQNQSQQQAKNDQQQQNQQSQKQNPENQKDQQQNSERPDKQKQASPSPSPGSENQKSDREKKDQTGAGESPTPSPGKSGQSPSPTPGENSSSGESPAASGTPSASPAKPRSGEIKSAGEAGDDAKQQEQAAAAAAEAEAMQRGEMSPQQAARLLQAMKDEEARVQLDERKPVHPVYKDW